MADEQQQTEANGETPAQGETPTFDEWYGSQDEGTQQLIEGHTQGLRAALDSERTRAKTLAKDLKSVSKTLDENSEAAQQLQALTGKLEAAEAQATFYEQATAAGCRDLRLAWLAAKEDDMNIDQVKAAHPDLFAQPRTATANAGNGTQARPPSARSMNDYIRQAAGRR
jgi:hypothetical protein